jgi:hypothetical protein
VKGFEECCVSNAVDETDDDLCSVHGPTRCTFLCILYYSIFLALHVSDAICT